MIVCIALITCIVGASLGILSSVLNRAYGCEITFYLVPADSSQALLPLLRSESFAEKLLLEENGLPKESECDAEDYAAALKAINDFNDARELKRNLKKELDLIPYSIAPIEKRYSDLKLEYEKIYDLLNTYKTAPSDEVAKDPNHSAKISEYEEKLALADQTLTEYKQNIYDPAITDKLLKEEEFASIKRLVDDTRLVAEELSEKLISKWREKDDVQEMMSVITSSVSFKYAKVMDGITADTAENQNSAFLIINVSVDNDKDAADLIIERIKSVTPEFAEQSLERLVGSIEPKCRLVSTFANTEELGGGEVIKKAVIFAAALALVSVACACTLIVAKGSLPKDFFDSKDKSKN